MNGQVLLAGFEHESVTLQGRTRDVFTAGEGPPVMLIHGVPGIEPSLADFGLQLARLGFTAVLPSLFGEPGRRMSSSYAVRMLTQAYVSRDFNLRSARSSRIADWLTMLAASLGQRHHGQVGVVGNSMSGDFGLQMMGADEVTTAVLANPALPFPLSAARRRELGLDPDDWAIVRRRVVEGCQVLGLRFSNDAMVPAERFDRLREELGDSFISFEIDSSPGNQQGVPAMAHSVITEELALGDSVALARLAVINFLGNQLGVGDRLLEVSKWEEVKARQEEIRDDVLRPASVAKAPGSVFVSYAHEDGEYVGRLIDHLSDDLPGIWSDKRLQTGDLWSKALRDSIDAAAAVVVVMSPSSSKSPWVTKEVLFALARDKPMLPILLDGEPIFELIDKEYCDVRKGELPPRHFVEHLLQLVE